MSGDDQVAMDPERGDGIGVKVRYEGGDSFIRELIGRSHKHAWNNLDDSYKLVTNLHFSTPPDRKLAKRCLGIRNVCKNLLSLPKKYLSTRAGFEPTPQNEM